MRSIQFEKVFTALITPFDGGKIDFNSLGRLIKHQVENGISGFVVNGTTAESPTLTGAEVKEIYHFVRGQVGKDFPLILGTGSNSTESTIIATKKAVEWEVDGVLVVTPYYNKPTQGGLFQHFSAVASECPIPILLYNVPGRTLTSIEIETLVRLSQIENIVGVKEASGDVEWGVKLIQSVPAHWLVTSGDDESCLDLMRKGGRGVVSVLSHIIPKEISDLALRAMGGDSSAVWKEFSVLINSLYVESNPIPVKMALYKMGLIVSPEMRLPMTVATEETAKGLVWVMKKLEII